MSRLGRRDWLLGTGLSVLLSSQRATAMGRTPLGGHLRFDLPWPVSKLDPHELDDACAAFFSGAICDPLFDVDQAGRSYPALADGPAVANGKGWLVKLRPGLVTGLGRAIGPADVHWSLVRAKARAARGLLAEFGAIRATTDGVLFERGSSANLTRALASSCCAILPRGFDARRPDGTGAFTAKASGGGLVLRRNPRAARGAAYLEQITLKPAGSIADALRAFETGEVDIGWLGDGLHRRRPGALPFKGPQVGWIVLRTGSQAGAWAAPGVAQSLVDGLPRGSLTRFGLSPTGGGSTRWGGGDAELSVDTSAPFLVEVAEAIASTLSHSGSQIRVARVSAQEIQRRRRAGAFALMLDVVRNFGLDTGLNNLALLTAANPALANRPPKLSGSTPAQLARSLPLGIVGELRPEGYVAGTWRALTAWDFGRVYVPRS
ncbi:MAG: hypothetical protein H6718_29445 [Polyangiaceae bacterium]|nr:hypothetical protein [Myxococcales bacterium]MCB9589575.1 hypothetical protein [Polyangiaceae bacterium]MCB9609203.1 hypothetical protein [Polyangiaceae bacterium]